MCIRDRSCIVLKHDAYERIQGNITEDPNVSCEIQIVMINDKNKIQNISKVLDHPFFKII